MSEFKKKLAIIVGTRPEIIRLSEIIKNSNNYFNLYLIHTGQNYDYELNKIFFKDLNIKEPDYYLDCASKTSITTISNILKKTETILKKINPDAFLILGDTNSALSSIVAKKLQIPIFHYEAGNRCFDQRVPEEINRKLVDHISDINITYSSFAKSNLINEGIKAENIFKVGSPMKEVINSNSKKISKSNILKKLGLKKNNYFVVSLHREENVDDKKILSKYIELLNNISNKYKKLIIFSTHPRTKKNILKFKLKLSKNIKSIKPLSFTDYLNLQINSIIVLSDSGTISEESSILNFRAINIRENHERHEAFEEASVMFSGPDFAAIDNYMDVLIKEKREHYKIVTEYNIDKVSLKVLRIILSHIAYVNKNIWKK